MAVVRILVRLAEADQVDQYLERLPRPEALLVERAFEDHPRRRVTRLDLLLADDLVPPHDGDPQLLDLVERRVQEVIAGCGVRGARDEPEVRLVDLEERTQILAGSDKGARPELPLLAVRGVAVILLCRFFIGLLVWHRRQV